jgi:hypothetical protein
MDGSCVASSPGRERCWLTLLGGIIRVFFELKTRWAPDVGIQVRKLEPKHDESGINMKV